MLSRDLSHARTELELLRVSDSVAEYYVISLKRESREGIWAVSLWDSVGSSRPPLVLCVWSREWCMSYRQATVWCVFEVRGCPLTYISMVYSRAYVRSGAHINWRSLVEVSLKYRNVCGSEEAITYALAITDLYSAYWYVWSLSLLDGASARLADSALNYGTALASSLDKSALP